MSFLELLTNDSSALKGSKTRSNRLEQVQCNDGFIANLCQIRPQSFNRVFRPNNRRRSSRGIGPPLSRLAIGPPHRAPFVQKPRPTRAGAAAPRRKRFDLTGIKARRRNASKPFPTRKRRFNEQGISIQ